MKDDDKYLLRDIKNLEETVSGISDTSLNTVVQSIPNRLDGKDGDIVFLAESNTMKQHQKINGEWYETGLVKRASNSLVWSQRRLLPNIRSQRRTSRSGVRYRTRYAKELSRRRRPARNILSRDEAGNSNARLINPRERNIKALSPTGTHSIGDNAKRIYGYGVRGVRGTKNSSPSRLG